MINIEEYGFVYSLETEENKNYLPARVTAVHRELFKVICCYGEISAKLKACVYHNLQTNELFPTVGDFVLIQYNESGDSLIVRTINRKSCFTRKDPDVGRGEQAVAANFDYVFILSSLNHDFNVKRLERYLTASWQSGGIPVVVLTKADLTEDYSEQVRAAEKAAAGVCVFAVSAKTGLGLEQLSEFLKPGKTIVFLGSSGVGKSSLVNALAGEELMKTNEIREDDSKGHHTTTHRQLILLKSGVMVIDTPGMRELGMWDVTSGLGEAFTDVENLFARCKFYDCTHTGEPGCAVHAAIASGELDESRWQSYLQLKKEARFSDDKAAYLREKQKWHKDIAKSLRSSKKNGGKWQ